MRALRRVLIGGIICVACSGCQLIVDFDRDPDAGMDADTDGAMPDAMTMEDGALPDGAAPDAMPPVEDAGGEDAAEPPMDDAGMDAGMDAGGTPMDGSVPVDAALDGGDAGPDAGA